MAKAICLYSGGLDSTTALYLARMAGFEVTALTVDYGQRHRREIEFASRHAEELKIQHHILKIALPWKGSSLLDQALALPEGRKAEDMSDIPSTYVPGRNSIFLALAASCAEASGAEMIYVGVNALDYSGYPDCRPEYVEAFEKVLKTGTKAGVEGKSIAIEAPLLFKSKKEIVEMAGSLGVPFEKTWSCYRGGGRPCLECDACRLRAKGFQEAHLIDTLLDYEISADHPRMQNR